MSEEEAKEATAEVNCRILIENRQVGYIIGRKGQRIQEVREQCGKPFFMSVLKSETRNCDERVMALRGLISQIAKAVQLISDLIILGTKENVEDGDTASIRFLVHKFQVGAIIGKGGETIQAMQNETDCKIQIGADDLPGSTEKSVTVTGAPANLHEVTVRIYTQLKAFPLRAGTRLLRYKPGAPALFGMQPPGMPPMQPGGPQVPPYGMPMPGQQAYYGMPPVAYGMPPVGYGGHPGAQVTSTQKIAIPTVCAGVVIGRGGSIIRDIRARTGCSISIQDADESCPNERVVVLTGVQQGIQQAIVMIRQLVEQYQPQDY